MLQTQGPNDIVLMFPTPVMIKVLPDTHALNEGLRKVILARAETHPSVGKSNVEGWQSSTDMFSWGLDEIAPLREIVVQAVSAMTRFTADVEDFTGRISFQTWANVSWAGAYNKPHNHAGSMWSGVYYVDTGTDPEQYPHSGTFELLDPRVAANMIPLPGSPFANLCELRPVAGMLLLFPSWLLHYVNPYKGEGVRVSVAFNARISNTSVPGGAHPGGNV